jgi:hypothetical protein
MLLIILGILKCYSVAFFYVVDYIEKFKMLHCSILEYDAVMDYWTR